MASSSLRYFPFPPSPSLISQTAISSSITVDTVSGERSLPATDRKFAVVGGIVNEISAMSCNGCRVLRKGCSESCVLRPCLQWIESPEAQGHATVFVAKFFGRAGLTSFLSAVPESQRPALFQSLLFESCGRTVNPVTGAVGLLLSGNWHLCQSAVETVLRGGTLHPLPAGDSSEIEGDGQIYTHQRTGLSSFSASKRPKIDPVGKLPAPPCDLDLCLTPRSTVSSIKEKKRPATPSMNSEESVATSAESCLDRHPKLLNLFV
ncbi:LOB domain-containing protein 38 [Apostasia shenzhenica]|uniref:LOB domain-containing protein 38 n=1 Tax=Apostasia shenzhenica TaxID=1088818 RepID=A0A2I0ADR3_9ASPA|nr:LOB domain-containing protein 38 [Apostasia shenzhenica]